MEDTAGSSEMWSLIGVNRSHRDLRSSLYCEDILVLDRGLDISLPFESQRILPRRLHSTKSVYHLCTILDIYLGNCFYTQFRHDYGSSY